MAVTSAFNSAGPRRLAKGEVHQCPTIHRRDRRLVSHLEIGRPLCLALTAYQFPGANGHAVSPKRRYDRLSITCSANEHDVFSTCPEFSCFYDRQDEVVTELCKLDLNFYTPEGAIEALAPKSRHGFRIAHQFSAADNLMFLACVIEIGQKIENKRIPIDAPGAFSYKFHPGPNGQIFKSDHTFRDWMEMLLNPPLTQTVVSVRLYQRIYLNSTLIILFHRIENLLDECAPKHGANRYIKKQISIIRAKQSFGCR